jgi:hypothetical protein
MLRRDVPSEFTSFRCLLLWKVPVTRDQVNLHPEIVDIRHEKLSLRVERSAAPIHATKIPGKGDNAINVWRSEHSIRVQMREALRARGSLGIRVAPDILG